MSPLSGLLVALARANNVNTNFPDTFEALTENRPFPWQEELFSHFAEGRFLTFTDFATSMDEPSALSSSNSSAVSISLASNSHLKLTQAAPSIQLSTPPRLRCRQVQTRAHLSGQEPVVFFMRQNHEPVTGLAVQASHSSIIVVDPCRPVFAHFLEVKRWMLGILPPEPKLLLGLSLNLLRELRKLLAKDPCRCRFHPAGVPPPIRFPLEHSARLHPVCRLSHRPRTADPKHLRAAARSNEPASRIARTAILRWLFRFLARNSRAEMCFNGATVARTVTPLQTDGAAVFRPRNGVEGLSSFILLLSFNGAISMDLS